MSISEQNDLLRMLSQKDACILQHRNYSWFTLHTPSGAGMYNEHLDKRLIKKMINQGLIILSRKSDKWNVYTLP